MFYKISVQILCKISVLIKVMQKQYQITLHHILIAALATLNKGPEI